MRCAMIPIWMGRPRWIAGWKRCQSLLWIFCLSASCAVGAPTPVPNPSFEEGQDTPVGWTPSDVLGVWERGGHTGRRCLSIRSDGQGSHFWKCEGWQPEPGRLYRLIFWAKSEGASGGCLISGLNTANQDFPHSNTWRRYSRVFVAPHNLEGAYLRLGCWATKGTVFFDDITITPVVPLHGVPGRTPLGEGERIERGYYRFQAPLSAEGSNFSRPLVEYRAGYNTNRWVFSEGSTVTYCHQVPGAKQRSAAVEVSVGYYTSGRLVVEASPDGKAWKPAGELSEMGTKRFQVPATLFPADAVWVRLRGEGKAPSSRDSDPGGFQVVSYAYEAALEGRVADAVGRTHYLTIERDQGPIQVSVASLGGLCPEVDPVARLTLVNPTKGPLQTLVSLQIALEGRKPLVFQREAVVPAGGQIPVVLPYSLEGIGAGVATLRVATRRQVMFTASTEFQVSSLFAADFGYLVSDDPEAAVWWAEGTHKISRERPAPKKQVGEVHISAARNEYEPFQVVVRPRRPLTGLQVEVEDLVGPKGARIVRSHVKVCVVHYVNITQPTDRTGVVGAWPDPLPPYESALNLDAGANQPLWVTVYVPPEVPAGDYTTRLRLQAGAWRREVPVRLHVWDFTLPKETHVRSAFGLSSGNVRRYHNLQSDEDLAKVMDLYYQNFAAHRISPYNPVELGPIRVSFPETADPTQVKVDFTDFDKAAHRAFNELGFNSFRLPVQGMGGGTFYSRRKGRIGAFEQGTPEYEALFTAYLRQVQDHLEQKGWLDKAYIYWFDEPAPQDYDFVKEGMALLKRAAPKLKRLLTEQVEDDLIGAVDIWCPVTPNYNEERARARQAAGEHIWWYVCTGPKAPYCTLFIDHPAIELRMWLWQTVKYGVEGILVWQSNYWTSSAAYPPPALQNPWEDPMSWRSGYDSKTGDRRPWGNGDGRFLYPPNRDPLNDTRPYLTGPIDSIRWEMLREGIEDFEYFHLLRQAVSRARAAKAPASVVANAEKLLTVPPEVCQDMTHFAQDPAPLYAHREKIAQAIETLQRYGP